jgi:acetyltransferase-like isoleucine patch superfamily enzyme
MQKMHNKIFNFSKYPSYFLQLCWLIYAPIYLRLKKVTFKKNLKCYGIPIVSKTKQSTISIGDNVVLCSNSHFTELGIYHPVIIRTLREGAVLSIGNNVGISGASICAAKKIMIGDNVMLGANVSIFDTDFHPITPDNRRHNREVEGKDTIIEDNVFIGANSIILKGSHIGQNSVIGAGSIVAGMIPENCIAAGNPAKVLKNIA